jgi:hypothetical protein
VEEDMSHWTNESVKAYRAKIVADWLACCPDLHDVDPSKVKLNQIIEYTRSYGLKIAIALYDDEDPKNERGPISQAVFVKCWCDAGKPRLLDETDLND